MFILFSNTCGAAIQVIKLKIIAIEEGEEEK